MHEQLLSKALLTDEEIGQTLFLYDPETNSDIKGSGAIITFIGGTALSDTLVNGHKTLLLPTTTSGFKAVFPTPIDLQGKNWTLEWSFRNTAASATYATETVISSSAAGEGILSRWGDNGFGHRLQLGCRFSTIQDCWSPAITKASTTNVDINMALSCKAGIVSVFRNGTKMGLANGTGPTYGAQGFPVSGFNLSNMINLLVGYQGSSMNNQPGFHGRIRLSLGGRYTRNYTVVPLELD